MSLLWEQWATRDTHRHVLLGWKRHFKGDVCPLEIGVVQGIQAPLLNGLRTEKWGSIGQRQPQWGQHRLHGELALPVTLSVLGPSWEVACVAILCHVRACVPLKHCSNLGGLKKGNDDMGTCFPPAAADSAGKSDRGRSVSFLRFGGAW